MIPSHQKTIDALKLTVEMDFIPELQSSASKGQALAMLQVLENLKQELTQLPDSLSKRMESLQSIARDFSAFLDESKNNGISDEHTLCLRNMLQSLEVRPQSSNYTSTEDLLNDELEKRKVFSDIQTYIIEQSLLTIEGVSQLHHRITETYLDRYGFESSYIPIWVAD